MGRFLSATDVLLVEQMWRFWRFRALAQGTPTLLLSNSLRLDDGGQTRHAFTHLRPAMADTLAALQAQAPHALFSWLNFPQPTAAWPEPAYDVSQAWARLDLFDHEGSVALLRQVLRPTEREAWRQTGERFLAAGKGAGDLTTVLTRLRG
jgi:hypothetical protein